MLQGHRNAIAARKSDVNACYIKGSGQKSRSLPLILLAVSPSFNCMSQVVAVADVTGAIWQGVDWG